MTTTSGSKTSVTSASPTASHDERSSTAVSASRSPASAAAPTCAPDGSPGMPSSRAVCASAVPEQYRSQQPDLPHGHGPTADDHGEVAEFGRDAVPPAVQLAVDHQSGADAGAERDQDRHLHAGRRADPVLGEGGGVDVVLHGHRQAQPFGEPGRHRAVPPGQVRGEHHGLLVRRDECGDGQPDRGHRMPVRPGRSITSTSASSVSSAVCGVAAVRVSTMVPSGRSPRP